MKMITGLRAMHVNGGWWNWKGRPKNTLVILCHWRQQSWDPERMLS